MDQGRTSTGDATDHSAANVLPWFWRFHILFWLLYWGLNIVFARVSGYSAGIYDVLFIVLSVALFGVTFGFHRLYPAYGARMSVWRVCLHLCWMLPLSAAIVQIGLAAIGAMVLRAFLTTPPDLSPFGIGPAIVYTMNTTIIMVLWCLIYLLYAEWVRRRKAEREYWENQLRLRELELQFLRSQINSHFLFNTLNNIRALGWFKPLLR